MGTVFSYIVTVALTFIISKFGQRFIWVNKKPDGTPKAPWPPSPSGLPYYTNAYQVFQKESYHALTRWSKELGDLYSVLIGQKRVIILNTPELVQKALVEKEQLNSSRLASDTMERLLTDQCKTIFTLEFSFVWSRLRRAVFAAIAKPSEVISKHMKESAKSLLFGISENGDYLTAKNLRQLVNMVAMDSALTLVYGEQKQKNLTMMVTIIKELEALEERQTRKYNRMGQFFSFVNSWLDVMSLFTLNSENLSHRNAILEAVLPLFTNVYQVRGDVPLSEEEKRKLSLAGPDRKIDSIVKSLLNIESSKNDSEVVQFTKDEILVNSVHMVLHAYTYLASTLFTLIQRLATETEFQTRLSESEDKTTLALAFVRESMRMDPPNPLLGYGPRTDYEFEVEGKKYRVDTDSELVVNVNAIHQHSRYFPHPEQFDPDRFLKSEKKTISLMVPDNTVKTARDHLAFGAGRRVCLGSRVSEDLLVTTLIQLNKAFRLEGGDVTEKIEHATNIWHWTGRTETKGSTIHFIKQ
ncbi:cytochrome P450 [Gilbertella persicaria]|uniref:cytochrome P450 n=1 Tax=Gilbertella persicaria TaxID=101096 RepID=UPI00221ED9AE|nr:cytochrome P450 [Gilbertella persicaria]KAI8061826.1 cytochrome P450 [Gilbertella persicaria]